MFYSSVLIIMHTNVFIMPAMLGNYHHYLIQGGFFFFFFCTQNRNSFPEASGPTPFFNWDNLHISPRMTPV